MLHSFVFAKLLPHISSLSTHGQRVAQSLNTIPFLALHLHETPTEQFMFQRSPNLFVITPEKPSSPGAEYFILNRPEANVRSLTVVPPLPYKGPLYLSVTPRIHATFLDKELYERLLTAEKYRLDESSLMRLQEALKDAGPSIPSIRVTGGDDEAAAGWDTWSGLSPRDGHEGGFVYRHEVPHCFDLVPFHSLLPAPHTRVYEELSLVRQLALDYTWQGCWLITDYVASLRQTIPQFAALDKISRPPILLSGQDRSPDPSVDALRPCTAHLSSLSVIHDDDANAEQNSEPEIADDWRDDVPELGLHMGEPVPAVNMENVKIVALDCNTLIDKDGPLQDALINIFPPTELLFAKKELLNLYVEYETFRIVEGKPDSPIEIIQDVARYLGVKVEDLTIKQALDTYATPRLYADAQDTIHALVQNGFTPVALPTATQTEVLSQVPNLSLALFDDAERKHAVSWDKLLTFARKTDPSISSNQIMIVTSDLYRIGESASKAGFPTAFLKVPGTRSVKLSIPTIASTCTLTSLTALPPALLDPESLPEPIDPVVAMYSPFRIHDSYQCTFQLGAGSFGQVWNGVQVHTGAGVAIKFELIHPTDPATIPYEQAIYAQLEGVPGIPRIHWSGQDMNANVLVMDKLGPDLEKLRRFCRGSFSLKTVLLLGEQMLSIIEHVHGRGIVVRDIKPQNFALGLLEECQRLHLLDMGLCKLFLDPQTGKHMPFREGRRRVGTARYSSYNVHFGRESSRRDDIEAIGILLLYLLHGRLPWQGIYAPDVPSKLRRIGEMKEGKPFKELLSRSPLLFAKFFEHSRSLAFEDKPDYGYLRNLLGSTMKEKGWEYDWKYDWLIPGQYGTLIFGEYDFDMKFVEPVRHRQDVL